METRSIIHRIPQLFAVCIILYSGCATRNHGKSPFNISTFTGETIPLTAPSIPHPKTNLYYAYSGTTLIGTFSIHPYRNHNIVYSSQLFAGNISTQDEGNYHKSTLINGAIRVMRGDAQGNANNIEVGRFAADTIVWYGEKKK